MTPELPDPTIGEALCRAARRRGLDELAVHELSSQRSLTYRGLLDAVAARAAWLHSHGAGGGRVVAVGGPEGIDTLVTVLACAASGAVALVLSPAAPVAAWSAALRPARPALAVATTPDAYGDVLRAVRDLGTKVSVLEEADSPADAATGHRARPDYQLVATSGSSERPKLVRIGHRGSLAAAQVYLDRVPLVPGASTVVPLSLASVGAMHSGVLPALLSGGRVVLAAGERPRRVVRALHEERAAFVTSFTAWWETCLPDPQLRDLPELHTIGIGGSPWHHLAAPLRERLPGATVLGIYGLTETHGPGVHATAEDLARHPGTAGLPARGLEVAVRHTDGGTAPVGVAGAVWLRGPLVTTGYVGAQSPLDADGWLRTGDLGRLGADGWLTVLGREDEVLNLGGRKVHPAQVEAALRTHPAVAACAVVRAQPAQGAGHLAAYVVLRAGGVLTGGDARAWVRERVASWAAPRVVTVVPALPRTPGGKVDRVALRTGAAGPAPALD